MDAMAPLAAQTLIRRLEIAGFVAMKRPPIAAHSTPKSRPQDA